MCIRTPGGEAQRAAKQAAKDAKKFQAMMAKQDAEYKKTLKEMKPKFTPAPRSARATIEGEGIRRKKSKKASMLAAGKGMGQLRIPLQGSSTNIG